MSSRRPVAWLVHVVVFAVVVLTAGTAATPAAANSKYASLIIDANTGADIRARNADSPRYPASLTKIMTLYVLFGEIAAGRIKKSDRITFSAHAAAQPPSKLGLEPGETITVDDAIGTLITKSANDVAAAVAEHISGTEWQFAKRMTETARALGMTRTTFRNASGLPNAEQKTTARDMATLGLRMMTDFPEFYKLFRLKSFTWRGNTYSNHNRLLGTLSGTEGIKTGYTRASGYNLVASARRGDKIAIGVVMGGKSGSSRDAHMRAILEESFPKLSTQPNLSPRPKPALVAAAPATPAPEPAPERAEAAPTRPGTVKLTMVEVPPRSRELPLAEPVSRPPGYTAAGRQQMIKPTVARAAVMRAAPLPPTAMSAYQVASSVPAGASAYVDDAEGSMDPIERLIAAAMEMPDIAGEVDSTRAGRLIVPERAASPAPTSDEGGGDVSAVAAAATPGHTPEPEAIEIPAGYQIQVGAYASQSDAQRRLETAQKTASELLAEAMGFTPSVENESGTIYRARFAGLDKQSATRACSALKKRSIDCIVVAR